MGKVNAPIFSLNGGEVGDEGLARLDLERLQFSGSLYSNMMPRVIGSMTFRPGLEHVADIDFGEVTLLEYSYSGGSSLVPILSDQAMRVVKNNALVSRVAVSTTVTNGDFASFTGWTDNSSGGASASVSGGSLILSGTTQDRASATQTIPVSVGDQGKEHGLRIDVQRGPIKIRLGSASGADDLIAEGILDDGVHSISFTPAVSNIYLELFNDEPRQALIDGCQFEGAGAVALPTPWTADDLAGNIIRYKQNKDVIYVASSVYQQREIQRRNDTSWGVQRYKVDDGPFVASDGNIALTPSGFTGSSVTLTASRDYFESNMIGRLFRLFQSGQTVEENFTTDPAEGDHVRISGVGTDRRFAYRVQGTWTGTVRLQIATDDGSGNPGSWSDLVVLTGNVPATNYTDPDDNVIKFVRFAVENGDIASGTIETRIAYGGGSAAGTARIIGYTSRTQVTVEVLSRFFSLDASFEWDYSTWSDHDGWPAAVDIFGGRIYWGLSDMIYGSVPDAFKSFDDEVEGDSAPISRSINASSQRGILWLLGLQRLIAGTDASEVSIKASSFDEPLTAGSWFPVDASTRGCANLRSVKADKDGIFIQASGTGAFRMSPDQQGFDYVSSDLMAMHEKICDGSPIIDVAVQRRPDTIVWFILANGEARALTYEPAEGVIGWSRVVTDGLFKRVAASRGAGEDNVYFAVVRGGTQRLEKLAKLNECRGGVLNCLADGFSRFTATAGQTTFSVPHLNGLDVTVWANGVALHDQDDLYSVSGGEVTIAAQSEGASVVIGLPYVGDYQSTKLAYGAQNGTALFHPKKVSTLGLYLVDTAPGKLLAGKDFDTLRPFTATDNGRPLADGEVVAAYDADMTEVSSDWSTDSRICLRAVSPYPATVAAMVLDVSTSG